MVRHLFLSPSIYFFAAVDRFSICKIKCFMAEDSYNTGRQAENVVNIFWWYISQCALMLLWSIRIDIAITRGNTAAPVHWACCQPPSKRYFDHILVCYLGFLTVLMPLMNVNKQLINFSQRSYFYFTVIEKVIHYESVGTVSVSVSRFMKLFNVPTLSSLRLH